MALNTRQIIALKSIPNCGNKTIKNIADYAVNETIGTTKELVELMNICIKNKIASRIKEEVSIINMEKSLRYADYILEKSEELDIKAITYQDTDFPKPLLNTIDETGKSNIPIILYYKGDIKITEQQGIAIIGTREPTVEGVKAGTYLGELFAESGYNIVSGLAVGCDTAGHKGALLSSNGKTTAFLAHGLDSVYPEENTNLAEEIVERGGLLLSEYTIGERVNRYNLVARDRLQAALSVATIVIQTGITGGTMHAANTTLKANKPLFCVKYTNMEKHDKIAGNDLLVNKGSHYLSSHTALQQVEEAVKKTSKAVQQTKLIFE